MGTDRPEEFLCLLACTLDMRVDLVHADAKDQLIVADIAVKIGSFRVVAVYVPNDHEERISFFLAVGAIPGGFNMPSVNGGLECHPVLQVG